MFADIQPYVHTKDDLFENHKIITRRNTPSRHYQQREVGSLRDMEKKKKKKKLRIKLRESYVQFVNL